MTWGSMSAKMEMAAKAITRDMVKHQVLEWASQGGGDLVAFCEDVLTVLRDLREAEEQAEALAGAVEALSLDETIEWRVELAADALAAYKAWKEGKA